MGHERILWVIEVFLITHIADSIFFLSILQLQLRAGSLSKGNPEPLSSHPFVVFQLLSHVQLFCDPMDYIGHKGPLTMEFPRQEYQSGLPFPSPGGLPDPGIKPKSPSLEGRFSTTEPLGKPKYLKYQEIKFG